MNINLKDITIFFQWGCMFASGIFSIRLIGNNRIPKYMRNFYWYSLVGGASSTFFLLQEFFDVVSRHALIVTYSALLAFHFIFLSAFIYKVLPKKHNQKYLTMLFYFFLSAILFYLITNDLSFVPASAWTVANFGLVLFCCIYYFQLFKDIPKINLVREPSFWVINGIFFCMCATIPVVALRDFLHDNLSIRLFYSLISIGGFAYGVMHLFFIKAYFLCSTNASN